MTLISGAPPPSPAPRTWPPSIRAPSSGPLCGPFACRKPPTWGSRLSCPSRGKCSSSRERTVLPSESEGGTREGGEPGPPVPSLPPSRRAPLSLIIVLATVGTNYLRVCRQGDAFWDTHLAGVTIAVLLLLRTRNFSPSPPPKPAPPGFRSLAPSPQGHDQLTPTTRSTTGEHSSSCLPPSLPPGISRIFLIRRLTNGAC